MDVLLSGATGRVGANLAPALAAYLAAKTGQDVVPIATPLRRRVNVSVDRISEAFYPPVYTYQRMIDDALAFRAGEDLDVIAT